MLSGTKNMMAKPLLFWLSVTFCICSCKKDHDVFVIGIVIQKSGCFQDSYLVAIENPDFSQHPFLRPSIQSCVACYDCSNAVYVRLNTGFEIPGTKIRFQYKATDISCLSYSEAPPHIVVKNISKI
jgi:hypothetical protein